MCIDVMVLLVLVEDCIGCVVVGMIVDLCVFVEVYENECVLMCARRLYNFVVKSSSRGGEELFVVVKVMKLEL